MVKSSSQLMKTQSVAENFPTLMLHTNTYTFHFEFSHKNSNFTTSQTDERMQHVFVKNLNLSRWIIFLMKNYYDLYITQTSAESLHWNKKVAAADNYDKWAFVVVKHFSSNSSSWFLAH
jgi:hypothetical protein